MNILALTLHAQGDLGAAREISEQVLAVRRRVLGEEHPHTLESMNNLAGTLQAQGNLDDAREIMLSIPNRGELSGSDQAGLLGNIAATYQGANDLEEAQRFFLLALETIEDLTSKADASEDIRGRFRDEYSATYRATIGNSLDLGLSAEAFSITERYRAQSLLTLLSADEDSMSSEIPPDLAKQREEIADRYDAGYRELDRLSSARKPDKEAIAKIVQGLKELRYQRDVLDAKIRDAVRGEEWKPPTATLDEIRQALDPGTLLISYVRAYEGKGVHVFLLSGRDGLEARFLDVDHGSLRLQIVQFYQQVREGQASDAYRLLTGWLYDRLVAPVADRAEQSERLVILPDGLLHYLPFAALRCDRGSFGEDLQTFKSTF